MPRRSRVPAGVIAAGAGLGAALLLGPGLAPSPTGSLAAQEPPDVADGDTIVLEGVDVSVLRTTTSMASSPMAVSVLTEDRLRSARSGVFLEEALRGMPGVQVQNRFNPAVGERVAIRGFGARAQFGMRGIRVVVDGIPATLPDGQSTLDHLDIGTLGRVEAVRGPASALFGNASGGVLSFHTKAPAPETVRAEIEQVLGSHGLERTQTTASGTLGETGYLVSFSRVGWDGFRTVPADDEQRDEVGASYGEAERFGLNSRVTRRVAGGELGLTFNYLDLDAENPGSVTEEFRDDPDRPVVPFPYLAHETRKELEQAQGGARWEGPLGDDLDLDVSVFGVRRSLVNPIPFNVIDLSRTAGGARARLARSHGAGGGELRWQAGVDYELQNDDRLEHAKSFGGEIADDPQTDQEERVRSAGLFLQANLELPGRLEALAGLRYDRHEFRAEDRIDRGSDGASATGSRSMDAVSPSLAVNLPLDASTNAFASVGTVFETPSTTELKNRPDGEGGFNPELEPQSGTALELGLRRSLGSSASFEVALYRTNLRNELIPFEVPEVEGQVFFRNVGSSRHTGMEATLSAASATGLVSGDVAYTWTDARFRSYELEGEALGGNRVPGLAPHRAQGTVRLSMAPWFGAVTGSYVHDVPMDDRNTASAPSHFLLDLRSGLDETTLGGVGFAPWIAVTNVLDRIYTASAAVNAVGGRYFEPGPGRSVQVGVRASF